MVKDSEQQLDGIFHALSDKTRRAILSRLAEGECHVTELAAPFRMSLAAVSKHIKVLEDAGLVQKTKSGRNLRCQAKFDALENANALLEQLANFWDDRLNALDQFLSTTGEQHDGTGRRKKHPKGSHPRDNSRKKRKSI